MEVLVHAQHMAGVQMFMNWQNSTLPYIKYVYILCNFYFSFFPTFLENLYLTIQDFLRHSLFRNLARILAGDLMVCVCECECVLTTPKLLQAGLVLEGASAGDWSIEVSALFS